MRQAASINAYNARKRAKILQRTPPWLTQEHLRQIRSRYAEARNLTRSGNVAYEVDHIVPLCGKSVSGLHVPWNLRVIPWHENRRKNNKVIQGLEP